LRIRFGGLSPEERSNLREFLKFVQETTRASQSETSYLQMIR
jgi:hypothetical protein